MYVKEKNCGNWLRKPKNIKKDLKILKKILKPNNLKHKIKITHVDLVEMHHLHTLQKKTEVKSPGVYL